MSKTLCQYFGWEAGYRMSFGTENDEKEMIAAVGEYVDPVSSLFALEIPLLMENLLVARAWLWSEQVFVISARHCGALTPFCKMFLLMLAALFAKI